MRKSIKSGLMRLFHRCGHTGDRVTIPTLIGLLLLTVVVAPAAADPAADTVNWYLRGVTFSDGARATGWFTYDPAINFITDWNIRIHKGPHSQIDSYTISRCTNCGDVPGPSQDGVDVIVLFNYDEQGYEHNLLLFLPLTNEGAALPPPGPIPLVVDPYWYYAYAAYTISEHPGPWAVNDMDFSGGRLTTHVPEPCIFVLFGSGLVSLWGFRKKFFNK